MSAVICSTLVLGGSATAYATPTGPASSADSGSGVASPAQSSSIPRLQGYTDSELLELILAGQGRAMDENPEMRQILGFAPDKPRTEDAPLRRVINDYLEYFPSFNTQVAKRLQSGQPDQVDAGLRVFSKTFLKFIELKNGEAGVSSSSAVESSSGPGWLYMGAYVAVYVNAVGVANAAVYANVGVATFVLATAGVLYLYLEDGNPQATEFEQDMVVSQIADALAL